jgi:serine/threonine protein kinase
MSLHKIVHRDIKLDNVLFSLKEDLLDIRLADFGLSIEQIELDKDYTRCGTPGYVAPEVLRK